MSRDHQAAPAGDRGNNNNNQDGNTAYDDDCIVHVGNISFNTTWQTLKDRFREVGEVRFADLIAEPSGRPRGSGLVTFVRPEDARRAVEAMNGVEIDGRPVYVRKYEGGPKPPLVGRMHRFFDNGRGRGGAPGGGYRGGFRGGFNDGGRGRGGPIRGAGRGGFVPRGRGAGRGNDNFRHQDGRPGCQVFVSNLPFECDRDILLETFSQIGEVASCDIMTDSHGRSRGMGIVVFNSPEDAARAIEEFDTVEMRGRPMSVRLDKFNGQQ